ISSVIQISNLTFNSKFNFSNSYVVVKPVVSALYVSTGNAGGFSHIINNVVHSITSSSLITIFDSTIGDTTFDVLCRDSTFITLGTGAVTYSGTVKSIQLANVDWPNLTPAPGVVGSFAVP